MVLGVSLAVIKGIPCSVQLTKLQLRCVPFWRILLVTISFVSFVEIVLPAAHRLDRAIDQ